MSRPPAGDEARAQHVVHAEGLGGRGGRRGGVVRRVGKLLAQLQVVQDEPVAVVGNAQAVGGLAVGGGGKVGADPGGQPGASVCALGQRRPVQRAQRGVNPVEVAAPVRREETVGQADLVDGKPGVALQVQGLSQVYLKVAVRAGHPLAAVHVDRRHSFLKEAARSADDGGWTAATEVQQEIFSHFALISVELANSFWPRKLSAAPIGFSFQCETLFKALVEHFIPRLQVVDKEETVGFPRRLLV